MTMLTRKQHEAFEFIRGYVARHGYSPSYENIMQGVGIHSKSGVHRLVGALAERGYIRRRKGRTRSIEVVAQGPVTPAVSFWYLATPYSKYADGIDAAFVEASRQTALLIRAGVPVYCPITHMHPIAVHGGLDPLDHTIWLPANETFMQSARGLIVCKMAGWEDSYGIGKEIEFFGTAGKPIVLMTPGEIPEGVL